METITPIASGIFSTFMLIGSGWYIISVLRKGRLDAQPYTLGGE